MSLFRTKQPTGKWYIDHSLSLVITAILLVQIAFAVWSGYGEYVDSSQDYDAQPVFWSGDFWQFLAYEVNMSTLADTYGVLLIVLLSKFLYERGSSESEGT